MKSIIALLISTFLFADAGQEVFNAAESQNWKKLEALIKKDKSLANAKDKEGQSILMLVAGLNAPKTAEFLKKHGADLKVTDSNGSNALMNAVMNGDVKTVRILWEEKTANAINNEGKNLLILAAESNNKEVIDFVLPKTMHQLEQKDKAGNTALLAAVQSANPDATRALVKAGAQLNVKNSSGKTPVDLAKELGLKETLKALQKDPVSN